MGKTIYLTNEEFNAIINCRDEVISNFEASEDDDYIKGTKETLSLINNIEDKFRRSNGYKKGKDALRRLRSR